MLDEICREGARRMLAVALEAEVDEYVERHAASSTTTVIASSCATDTREPRTVTTSRERSRSSTAGERPRVDPESGDRIRFRVLDRAAVVPPIAEGDRGAAAALPARAVDQGLRPGARGVLRFRGRASRPRSSPDSPKSFAGRARGVHEPGPVRDRTTSTSGSTACTSRSVSKRPACVPSSSWVSAPTAERSSSRSATATGSPSDSWSALLHDLRRRGMRAPMLAVGDGALGFWKALREVFPETKEQRDWVHKVVNVLAALPASIQPLARKMLAEIRDAEDKDHARHAAKAFIGEFEGRWPKATDKIDRRPRRAPQLLRLPARALGAPEDLEPDRVDLLDGAGTDPGDKGSGLATAGLAMAFKLIEAAQERWRSVNGPHLVALVRAGAKFRKGVLVEREPHIQEAAA